MSASTKATTTDTMRARFCAQLSSMYRQEVPLYGTLCELVASTNASYLAKHPNIEHRARLDDERHGAIRVGNPAELQLLRRMFALFGMYPVSYYDLASNGLPVHSTAFRPITATALAHSPFRIFCSLLRLELISDKALRQSAANILATRRIMPDELIQLITQAEENGQVPAADEARFINLAVQVFSWQGRAIVDITTYQRLQQAHPLLADIVAFPGPHINHLTPRTLDIDTLQQRMIDTGMPAKSHIEGPGKRNCNILLRQTSFHARSEIVSFARGNDHNQVMQHTARFGEVEQRGAALTRKGRLWYDRILRHNQALSQLELLTALPDNWEALRREGLIHVEYQANPAATEAAPANKIDINALIESKQLSFQPITYEDFLPASAAGIFKSNLSSQVLEAPLMASSQSQFEEALGCAVADEFQLYGEQQNQSLTRALAVIQKYSYS